jgi:hypothetical protein
MTRRDALQCVHEPFGDAFYYGPERLSARFENDEQERMDSGFADSTFKTVVDRLEKEGQEVRSFFFKCPLIFQSSSAPNSTACNFTQS